MRLGTFFSFLNFTKYLSVNNSSLGELTFAANAHIAKFSALSKASYIYKVDSAFEALADAEIMTIQASNVAIFIVYSPSPAKQNMHTDQVISHIDGRLNGAVEKLFVSLALHHPCSHVSNINRLCA